MSIRGREVTVRVLPETLTDERGRAFFRELNDEMETDNPYIVLDCSKVRQLDIPAMYLLLGCLEEAMKRNGDVKLASLPSGTLPLLELTGVARLFERFDTNDEAISSFRRTPAETFSNDAA